MEQRAGRRQLLVSACVSKSSQLRRGTGIGWSFYLTFSSLLPLSSPCVKQLVGFIAGAKEFELQAQIPLASFDIQSGEAKFSGA